MNKVFILIAFCLATGAVRADLTTLPQMTCTNSDYEAIVTGYGVSQNPTILLKVSEVVEKNGKLVAVVNKYTAICAPVKGADEAAYTCNVMVSTDNGYLVTIADIGDGTPAVSLKPWNMVSDNGILIPLTCPSR